MKLPFVFVVFMSGLSLALQRYAYELTSYVEKSAFCRKLSFAMLKWSLDILY